MCILPPLPFCLRLKQHSPPKKNRADRVYRMQSRIRHRQWRQMSVRRTNQSPQTPLPTVNTVMTLKHQKQNSAHQPVGPPTERSCPGSSQAERSPIPSQGARGRFAAALAGRRRGPRRHPLAPPPPMLDSTRFRDQTFSTFPDCLAALRLSSGPASPPLPPRPRPEGRLLPHSREPRAAPSPAPPRGRAPRSAPGARCPTRRPRRAVLPAVSCSPFCHPPPPSTITP